MEKFEKLTHEIEFLDAIENIKSLFNTENFPESPYFGDLNGAIEFEFLHNETYEQFFIDLNELDTYKFKLFVSECLLSDANDIRWYP
jgi:hypothetical protein